MEFSKYLGVAEGCSSSESGWTMYIVSPMHETKNNHHYHHHHQHVVVDDGIDEIHDDDYYNHMHHNNEDSDDSMVSDASSGPSRILRGNSKRRSGLHRDQSKHAANKDLMGKNQRQGEKLYDRRQKAGKDEEYKKYRNENKARKTY